MTDIFDYLNWRGDLPMQTVPMNEVDGMVFARIAYLPFEAFDVLHGETTVKDAAASLLAADDRAEIGVEYIAPAHRGRRTAAGAVIGRAVVMFGIVGCS